MPHSTRERLFQYAQLVCADTVSQAGCGRKNKAGPALGVVVITMHFTLQILWSVLWMRCFRYGPVE